MQKNTYIALALLIFLVCAKTYAQTKEYYNYSINAGFSGNYNINFSDFQILPGTTNCCGNDEINFKNAQGWGTSFWLGINKDFHDLLSLNTRMTLNLNYTNFASNFAEQGFFGNIINGDEISEGISETQINAKIKAVLLHYLFAVNPFEEVPFYIGIGFKSGLLLSGNFDQKEILLQPATGNFETGTRERNQSEGDLQDLSPFSFALTANASIDLLHFGDFVVSPQLSFDYGLTNLVKDISWKNSSLNLGINLAYRFAKPIIAPPLPPIIPTVPHLPIPEIGMLNLLVNIFDGNTNSLQNNEKIFTNINIIYNTSTENFLPMLFFSLNSDKIVEGYSPELLKYIAKHYKNLKDIKIGMTFTENNIELGKLREKAIIAWLRTHSIDVNNISFSHVKNDKKQRYIQAEEEKAVAEFIFSDIALRQISVETQAISTDSVTPVQLAIKSQITATATPYDYSIEMFLNDDLKATYKNKEAEDIICKLHLDWKYPFDNQHLKFVCKLTDAEQKQAEQIFNFDITPQITQKNYINSKIDDYYTEEIVLGFFDFDGTDFISIDMYALDKITKHLLNNHKIEVIGYTDNLGTSQYNSALALERAQTGTNLINNKNEFSNLIKTVASSKNRTDNSTPYNRTQNRVVVVRILK